MRGLGLLLFVILGVTGFISAHAQAPDEERGRVGLAVVAAKDSNGLVIDYVADKGPAGLAGIRKGDYLTAINGVSTRGMSLATAQDDLDGPVGTVVKLSIGAAGAARKEVSVVRRSLLDAYLPAANDGEARAQDAVATYYFDGPAATRDVKTAAQWYRKAADQGLANAEAAYGYLCKFGMGVPKDINTAAVWELKAAKQGDRFGEREAGIDYRKGEGVTQSDKDAFAWFYSGAMQDDAVSEYYLARSYRDGRGVARDYRLAFNWFYRSAEKNDGAAAWGLAYLYQEGLGVPANAREALDWYKKAEPAYPDDEWLKKTVARLSLNIFLKDPSSGSLDVGVIMDAFKTPITIGFIALALAYAAGGIVLLFFSLREPDAAPRLAVAIGWMFFFFESQGVALLAIFVYGNILSATLLFIVTACVSAGPVIVSTCGRARGRIWQASRLPWKALVLYGAGGYLALLGFDYLYGTAYSLFTHATLPVQPTYSLVSKARYGSAAVAYLCIGCILPAAEEIIFRYYLFGALRRRFSGNVAVVVTALLFSIAHFQKLYVAPLFVFGLMLGWVRLRSDSLRLPICLHAVNNVLSLAFAV